ncbi:outer membrane beta-barrel domain-containing protein [Corallincola platygyrae]|uniref:Outer membrane beta-barrel domain-containing protein n=1 Tax=Corallincola platygyrae TaxID=1193278 RepID=A0ABW4XSX9_9GAMM
METGCKRLLLIAALAAFPAFAQADETFEPKVERREIDEALIDDEDFQVGAYAGVISIEDFGSEFLWGVKGAYHVTEDFFIEANYGSSEAGETSFERLSGGAPLLTDSERDYSFYMASVGWNALPGEAFVWDKYSFNSAFYLLAGVGSTDFAGDDNFTMGFGAGYRLLVNDWLALDISGHDYIFDLDVTGEDKTTHNLALTAGVSVFF